MLRRAILSLFLPIAIWAAPPWVMVRMTDGTSIEGRTQLKTLPFERDGKSGGVPIAELLSVHSGAPASDFENGRIAAGLAAIQGKDRAPRDLAVEELTNIGLPVITPLLKAYKDTDQHEPKPLYRLFERVIPSAADGLDRTLSLARLQNGDMVRGKLAGPAFDVVSADGKATKVEWANVRMLAVRRTSVKRTMKVHALAHSTQIEFLDTGVALTAASKVESSAKGFVRLSWETDSWATDANGLTKPGSPAYKSNLVDGQPFGALVGRIGGAGDMFFVGAKGSLSGKPAGRLRLAVNDNAHWQNNLGSFIVTMAVSDAYDLGDAQ